MSEKTRNKRLIILSALLIFGLIVYAAIFLIINKSLNPVTFTGSFQGVHQRLFWRKFAEATYSLFGTAYIIGHILVIYHHLKNNLHIPFQKMLGYFIAQICIMLGCVMPFALFDLNYLGDYIFPIWNIAGTLFLILIIYSLLCLYKKNSAKITKADGFLPSAFVILVFIAIWLK